MTRDEALGFLRAHQPMPPDVELTGALSARYDEVRRFFLERPDPECVPLFLNSFGDGFGLGVYQLVDEVLAKFDRTVLAPHLVTALRSAHAGVRYWAAMLSCRFSSAELAESLIGLLRDQDAGCREAAAGALGFIRDVPVRHALELAFADEEDPMVVSAIQEALEALRDELR